MENTNNALPLGWHVSPNNIHGLPGRELFTGGPKHLPYGLSLWQHAGRLDLVKTHPIPCDAAGSRLMFQHLVLESSTSFEVAAGWVEQLGTVPVAGGNVWD